ncbi:MAG: YdbL family protein [Nitrospiraceae bacterium]
MRSGRYSVACAAALAIVLSGMSAWALTLDDAKAKGIVGEKPTGYLGIVTSHPEAQALVADINTKRRAAYEEIARRNGAKVEQIETLAGEKAIGNTKPGHVIQAPTGEWVKK